MSGWSGLRIWSIFQQHNAPCKVAEIMQDGLERGIIENCKQSWEMTAGASYEGCEFDKALNAYEGPVNRHPKVSWICSAALSWLILNDGNKPRRCLRVCSNSAGSVIVKPETHICSEALQSITLDPMTRPSKPLTAPQIMAK